jgi:hypothetical protein
VCGALSACVLCGRDTIRQLFWSGRVVPLCNPCFKAIRSMPSSRLDDGERF